MKVLLISDIIGSAGRAVVKKLLPGLVRGKKIDLVIANCENASGGFGLTQKTMDELFSFGIHILTSGNHIWDKKEILGFIFKESRLLRPANYPPDAPGFTYTTFTTSAGTKCIIFNLMGRVFMSPIDCPFRTADMLIEKLKHDAKIMILDFHAEATSEKIAMGWYLQGRVSAVIGTHTHVQTADERILPLGTAYITDAGMTGSLDSVIGMKREQAISRFLTFIPSRFEVAKENIELQGVIVDIDDETGKGLSIERVRRKLEDLQE